MESELSVETSFTVYLPQHEDPAGAFGSGTMSTVVPRGMDGDISRRGVLDPCTAFLQKRFTPTGLLRRVREVLDGDAVAA